jgi:exodeoxyribonuclease VII small subunit
MSPKEPRDKSATEPASFEEALARLENLVQRLEGGDVPLEDSLHAFEESQRLIQFCEKKLQSAEQMLRQLSREADDALGSDEHGGASS